MNTTPDSTLTRAYERIQTAGMDELVIEAAALINAMEADMDLRRVLMRERHRHVREHRDRVYAVLEKMGR